MMNNAVMLTFLGTNTLLIRDGANTLMIDPHFTRPGFWGHNNLLGRVAPDPSRITRGLVRVGVTHLDAVLLTHTHYDHALDAVEVARVSGARLIGASSVGRLASGAGFAEGKCDIIVDRIPIEIGCFQVSFIRGVHLKLPLISPLAGIGKDIQKPLVVPQFITAYKEGGVYAILIRHPSTSLLCIGSAGYFSGWLAGVQAETVILAIGGLDMMGPAYCEELFTQNISAPGATRVLFSHWDNFTRSHDDFPEFMPACRQSIIRLKGMAQLAGIAAERLEVWETVEL